MRLDVLHLDAVGAAERLERADLVAHHRLDLVGLEGHRPATEAEQIGVARLRTDRDARAAAERDGRLHDPEVAGVEAAGDVGAGDVRDEPLVVAEASSVPKLSPRSALRSMGVQSYAAGWTSRVRLRA